MNRMNSLVAIAIVLSSLYLVRTAYDSRRLYTELDRARNDFARLEVEHKRLSGYGSALPPSIPDTCGVLASGLSDCEARCGSRKRHVDGRCDGTGREEECDRRDRQSGFHVDTFLFRSHLGPNTYAPASQHGRHVVNHGHRVLHESRHRPKMRVHETPI